MKRFHPLTIICLVACVTGFAFSAVSTSDFVAHLDRQVHGIHCSFLPGLAAADQSGESGCHTTLMSPYSSILRSTVWGGIPIALPSMAVFAFLAFACVWLIVNGRERDLRATGFLVTATLVPVTASALMGYLSLVELGAACKLCIGIYSSSGVCFLSALILWRMSPPTVFVDMNPGQRPTSTPLEVRKRAEIAPVSWGVLAIAFIVGVVFVVVPVGGYAAQAPDFSTYVGSCGELPEPGYDPSALVAYGPQTQKTEVLMVLDPLCPSCKGFEERLEKMPIASTLDRKLLLFPLDDSCNWMIDRSIHPGACAVSEAVLCAEDPEPVIAWAFSQQQQIMAATTKNLDAAANMAKAQFPGLANCIGSPEAKAKLNLSLRWAVKNRLQVLTPQVFVEGARLCGEDTDLGLDYALPRLVERMKNRPLPEVIAKSEVTADAGAQGGEKVRAPRAGVASGATSAEERATMARKAAEAMGVSPDDVEGEEKMKEGSPPSGDAPLAATPAAEAAHPAAAAANPEKPSEVAAPQEAREVAP